MTRVALHPYTAGAMLLTALLVATPAALAAQQGVTSGPASGNDKTAVPNTAVAKIQSSGQTASNQGSNNGASTTSKAALGVGAPGVPAKAGSEGGPMTPTQHRASQDGAGNGQ